MTPPPKKPPPDPALEAAVERAIERYRSLLPADLLDELRQNLRFGLSTHEGAQDILKRLRDRVAPEQSADVATNEIADLAKKRKAKQGSDK